MAHVRLEVVPLPEDPSLCSWECPHLAGPTDSFCGSECDLFEAALSEDPEPPKRHPSCLAATALDAAESKVIRAAEIMARDLDDLHERGLPERSWERGIVAAVDALVAMRAEGGSGG